MTLHHRVYEPTAKAQDGPSRTLVLVHGWACDARDWDPVIAPLRRLGRVVTVDLPGSGESREVPGPYTLAAVGDAVAATVRRLDIRSPYLVGHSAGAEVAISLAERLQGGCPGAVAVDPAYGFDTEQRADVASVVARLRRESPAVVAVEYFGRIDGDLTPVHVRDHHPDRLGATDEAIRGIFGQFAFGPGALHFRPECDAFHRTRHTPLLAFYRNDARGHAGRVFGMHARDRIIVRDRAGHWLHHEQPDRFVREIGEWLAGLEASGD